MTSLNPDVDIENDDEMTKRRKYALNMRSNAPGRQNYASDGAFLIEGGPAERLVVPEGMQKEVSFFVGGALLVVTVSRAQDTENQLFEGMVANGPMQRMFAFGEYSHAHRCGWIRVI